FEGRPCVAGCGGCNFALPPCCSNHEDGKAVDLYLEGSNVGLPSSKEYVAMYYNNGGSGGTISQGAVGGDCSTTANPDLCLNQQNLRKYMTVTGSKFTAISNEWWHFDFNGDCSSATSTCTPTSSGKANNAYCKATGETIYKLAECSGSAASCPVSSGKTWQILGGSCTTGQHLEFSTGATMVTGVTDGYAGLPGCIAD
ncbi:MAG: hypothetical protein ACD_43C00192G0001, partial [uncultured bacterium]